MPNYDWIGGSADWNTGTKWSSGIVPGVLATATIANAGSNTVTIASGESIGIAGVTLANSNTLLVDGGFTASGTIAVTGALLSIASTGQFIDRGTLTDAGSIIGYVTVGQTAAAVSIASGAYFGNGAAHTALYASHGGTIINQGTLNDHAGVNMAVGYYAIRLATGGSINNSGTIQGNGFAALSPNNGVSLTNSGLISGSARDALLAGGGLNINNSGTIRAPVDAVVERNGTLMLTNTGTMTGDSAVATQNGSATISNQGVMAGTAGVALQLATGGIITNLAGGVISASNAHQAIYFGGSAYVASAFLSLTNAGTISGGVGIQSFGGNTLAQTVIDSGTIIGRSGSAVLFGGGNDLMQFQPSSSAFIQGTVNGGGGTNTLEFAYGATVGTLTGSAADFINFQTMQIDTLASWVLAGSDTFSPGTNLFDRGSLTIAGTVVANIYGQGQGPLTVTASGDLSNGGTGAAFYAINNNSGVVNFGTIAASGGVGSAGVRLKGSGSVANSGTITGNYGVVAYGPLTVTNSGTIGSGSRDGIFLRGGGSVGNTGVILGSTGIAGPSAGLTVTINNSGTIDGQNGIALSAADIAPATVIDSGTIIGLSGPAVQFGNGNNLMLFQPSASAFIQGGVVGGTGNNTLDFASGATAGTLTGSNAYFVDFGHGTIAAGASWVFAGTSTLGAGSTLVDRGSLTISGIFTNAGSLETDPPITVTGTFINSSIVSATSNDVAFSLGAAGTIINAASGLITVGTSTTFAGEIGIAGGGTAALLDNLGSIQGYSFGVSLGSGGTIINGASGNAAALLSGDFGAYTRLGLISNYGTISGLGTSNASVVLQGAGQVSNHAGGVITGRNIGIDLVYGAATMTNLGVVSATNNGVVTGYSDVLINGIGALITGSRAVVGLAAGNTLVSETLRNYGTITGQYGVIDDDVSSTGTLQATIVDAGTIIGTGGMAIVATATSASVSLTLQFLTGNDFIQGSVIGEVRGTGILDFASGSGSGTLTGSGADFTNFQTASVDAGARWVLAGSNTLGSNTTLVDAGTLINAGSLVVDPPVTVTGTFINGSIVSATGTYTAFYVANGGVLSNASGGTIIVGAAAAITAAGRGMVANAGLIEASSAGGYGVILTGGGLVTNQAGGVISGGQDAVSASGTVSVTNSGTIIGISGNAIGMVSGVVINGGSGATNALIQGGNNGVYFSTGYGTVINAGSIQGGNNDGIYLKAGGIVSNASSGTITGTGNDGVVIRHGGTVVNQGSIIGAGHGIAMQDGSTLRNSGLIVGQNGYGVIVQYGGTVANYGTIQGGTASGILLDNGGTVIDAGTVSGVGNAIQSEGTGSNLVVLEQGYALHGIAGYAGESTTVELRGTSAANAVTATYNSLGLTQVGTIGFASGASNYATWKITNTAALPGVLSNFTGVHDTIDLTTLVFVSGSSRATFNTASDQLTISNGATAVTLQLGSGDYSSIGFTATSDGATGTDIIIGPPPPTYDWTGGSADWRTATNWSSGTIPGIGAYTTIANAGSNTVTISSGESVQITGLTLSNNNTLLVDGTVAPTGYIDVTGARLSIAGSGVLTTFGTINVTNSTMLNAGTLDGEVTLNSGQFTNQTGGRVVNGYFYGVAGSSANSVANFGSISASSGYAVYLRGAGNVSNAAGALIFGPAGVRLAGTDATVINFGSIDAYQAFVHSYAVYLRNGGVVANGQAGDTTAAITGDYGIGIHSAPGTVVNDATVVAVATSGAAVDLAASGVVINGASTLTAALLQGGGRGVYASAGTVINYGTISATQASGGAFGVLIANGGTLSNMGSAALIEGYVGAQLAINGTVINAGTIASTQGTSGNALAFGLGNAQLIVDPGAVFIGNVYGVSSGSTTLELARGANSGTFTGLGTQFQRFNAATVDAGASWVFSGSNTVGAATLLTDAGTLTNIGSLVVDPPITVMGTFINSSIVSAPGTYSAITVLAGGVISNTSSGTIGAGGTYAIRSGGAATVVNLGTIFDSNVAGFGVDLASGSITNGGSGIAAALISGVRYGVLVRGTGQVVNYGTLSATRIAVQLDGQGTAINHADALITGGYDGIILHGSAESAINFGVVTSAGVGVIEHGGDVIINGGSGATAALISGARYGVAFETTGSQTLINDGTISGATALIGQAVGGTLNATIIDSGAIIGTGGTAIELQTPAGNANLLLQFAPGNAFVQGTVMGELNGVGRLEFASGATAGTLTGANAEFKNFQTASVDAGANWTLGGDVTLGTGITLNNAGMLDNVGTLTLFGAVVDGSRLINDGSINVANYGGLQLAAGGYLRNDATGLITRGTIGATSFNSSIIGQAGGPSTLVNDGTILNSQGDAAVYLRGGGVVINGATNATAALISGTIALYVRGLATISNFGTMSGSTGIEAYNGGTITNGASNSTAALVSAGQYGVVLDNSGTFTNYGTVTAGSEAAVRLRYGVVVTNAGRIAGAEGIVAQGGTAQITNAGTIIGTGGDGIQLAGAGTVIDSGAITGSATAIAFDGSGSNLLVLEQGYTLSGNVVGAASASNTLELLGTSAANAVVANYNSLSLSNFGTVAFATGGSNYATLKITNDAALPHTITGFTGFHDTIDLSGLSFVSGTSEASFNSASDQLTISNGATAVVLQLGNGSYTGLTWGVTNDGNGGTDVLPIPPGAPSITPSANFVGVPDQSTATPFDGLTVTDPNSIAYPDTLTVMMAAPGDGTFSTTVTGGSYDAATSTYTFTGTAAEVTAALQALQFTASAPSAGNLIATTGFTVQVVGIGGTASNDQISVTTVTQPASLADKPLNEDMISISPDGSGFAPPVSGDNNEAVITNPSNGGTYTLPSGYQAEFLGGNANATLTDPSGGNAVLVGNNGNDTLRAAAGDDTLIGGNGNNLLSISGGSGFVQAGTGSDTIVASGTLDTVVAAGHATVTVSGSGQQVLGNFADRGSLTVTATGDSDTISAGESSITGSIRGSSGIVYGGFGSIAGTLNLTVTGSNDTINPGNSNATVRSSGSSNLVYGGFGPDPGSLNVSLSGANDTGNPGGSAATVTALGNTALIYGTFGSITGGLHATVGGSGDTVNPGNDPATVVASGTGDLIYGSFGPNAAGLTVSVTGGSDTVNPGRSAATVFAAGDNALVEGYFASGGGPLNVQLSGANDTVNPGLDTATVRAAGHNDLILGSFTTPGAGLTVTITGANDTVEPGNTPATIIAGVGNGGAVGMGRRGSAHLQQRRHRGRNRGWRQRQSRCRGRQRRADVHQRRRVQHRHRRCRRHHAVWRGRQHHHLQRRSGQRGVRGRQRQRDAECSIVQQQRHHVCRRRFSDADWRQRRG